MTTHANGQPGRAFTPARIVALVLIALVALGLAYLRFGPDDGAVVVPTGAQAGDLALEPCEYATERGSYAADCGTLVVPENRDDPQSRLIALPVTRVRAVSDDPAEPIFRLEGGPGLTNMEFRNASRFADGHDVVLVGYRGVDGSVRLDCPEVESAVAHSTDLLGEKSFRAYADGFRACAERLTADDVDLAGYGLVQRVDDLEAAREALGYDRVDLLSESAGTRTALFYAWRYPESVHRSVMIGVNPPGHFLWDPETTDELIDRYADLCAKEDGCRERTDDLAASMQRTDAEIPDRWLLLPVEEGNVRVASFFGVMESTPENAPLSAPLTIDSWLSADEVDAGGFWFQSLLADLVFPKSVVWGEYAAAGRADARTAREYFSDGQEPGSNLGRAATAFVWGNGLLVDAWPAATGEDEYATARRSDVETLLVSGALDFATPPQAATRELLPHLPNGSRVILPGFGHTVSFWMEQPDAGTHLVTTFFDTGRVDDSLYRPQSVDFTPSMTLSTIARIAVGSIAGLVVLAALTLLWLAVRVRMRGRVAPRWSAFLRSVYPILLGLGGWLLGVLVVLTTMPGVPVDDQVLATLSVGLPVGLGIHLAWVHRDWPAGTRARGFLLAAGGALAGAWLGFHAVEGIVALGTAIAGAIAGANLALVVFDVARERSARDRAAAAGPVGG